MGSTLGTRAAGDTGARRSTTVIISVDNSVLVLAAHLHFSTSVPALLTKQIGWRSHKCADIYICVLVLVVTAVRLCSCVLAPAAVFAVDPAAVCWFMGEWASTCIQAGKAMDRIVEVWAICAIGSVEVM